MAKRRPRTPAAAPEPPPFRHLLDQARPVRDFAQAIGQALEILEAALAAEGILTRMAGERQGMHDEIKALGDRQAALGHEIEQERRRRMDLVDKELRKAESELARLRTAAEQVRTEADVARHEARAALAGARAEAQRLRDAAKAEGEEAQRDLQRKRTEGEGVLRQLEQRRRTLSAAVEELEQRRQQAIKAIEALIPR